MGGITFGVTYVTISNSCDNKKYSWKDGQLHWLFFFWYQDTDKLKKKKNLQVKSLSELGGY